MCSEKVDFELIFGLCIRDEFTNASETCPCIVDKDVYATVYVEDLLDNIRCHMWSGVGDIQREPLSSGGFDFLDEFWRLCRIARSSYYAVFCRESDSS